MGDMGDFWRDVSPLLKEESSRKKARNKENAIRLLKENFISYEEKNLGVHFIVEGIIDYYPTTGKWICRKTGRKSRGIFKLLKYVKGLLEK